MYYHDYISRTENSHNTNSSRIFFKNLYVTGRRQLLSVDDGHIDGNWRRNWSKVDKAPQWEDLRISQNQNSRYDKTTAGLIALMSLHINASDLSEAAQTVSKGASGEAKAPSMPLKTTRMAKAPATIPKGSWPIKRPVNSWETRSDRRIQATSLVQSVIMYWKTKMCATGPRIEITITKL